MNKKIFESLKVILLAFILVVGVGYIKAWTGPSATAPGGNVAAPINVGSAVQTKLGSLIINAQTPLQNAVGLTVFGSSTFNGSISIVDGTQGVGKVLTSGLNGVASWQTPSAVDPGTSYTLSPVWNSKIICPTTGSFTNPGEDGAGAANDLKYYCKDGYVISLTDGNHTPASVTTDSLPRCNNTTWLYLDDSAGNDLDFYCQSSGGYLQAIMTPAEANPTNSTSQGIIATGQYPAGQGVYCNWTGVYRGNAHNDTNNYTDIDCEGNHVYSMRQESQPQPAAFVQGYKLVPSAN